MTSSRLPSVHTPRFNPLALEIVLPGPIVRIATYARVSSDEQRDRHTVLNQRAALSRRLSSEPGVHIFNHYEDDGVSGAIVLEERPAGRALARDVRARRFSQIWVVRAGRLGRDAFELLRIWRVFESIGVALRATDENIDDPFYFDIHAVIAANERRKFLERSASEGRYTGSIVPLGYTVSGDRGSRRLVPDYSLMWSDLSAADVVRRIYHHLGPMAVRSFPLPCLPWSPMKSGTPLSPPSSAIAPCPATLAMPTSSAPSSAAPSAASPSAVPGQEVPATGATAPWRIAARSRASASAPPSRARSWSRRSGRMSRAS